MGILGRRSVKPCDKPIEERTVIELIETVEHVNPMNKSTIVDSYNSRRLAETFPHHFEGILDSEERYWVNPNNQTSFVSGWFSHRDFIDWANGTGKIVRGETQKQKDKFMRYDKAYSELDLQLFIYSKHLDLIDSESKTVSGGSSKWGYKHRHLAYKNPINLSNRRDSSTVIKELYSSLVPSILRDIKDQYSWGRREQDPKRWLDNLRKRHQDEMHGTCRVLAMGGHGYYDACNTPTELENLSWSKDLVWAKAYSLFIEEIDPGIVECIRWCDENQYKIK